METRNGKLYHCVCMGRSDSSSKLLAEFGEMHTILTNLYFSCSPETRATLPLSDALSFQGAFDHAMLFELLRAWDSIAKKPYPLLVSLANVSATLDDLLPWANRRWSSEGFLLSANWETLPSLSPAMFRDVMHNLGELVEDERLAFFATLMSLPKPEKGRPFSALFEEIACEMMDDFLGESSEINERFNNSAIDQLKNALIYPFFSVSSVGA